MLFFDSHADVISTLEALSDAYEEQEDSFMSEYDNLSDSLLNELEDSIGYNDQAPLEDFENQFGGFSSLRNKIIMEEENWLANNDELDIEDDPDSHYIVDEYIRTIVNEEGQFGVGDTVIELKPNYWVKFYGPGLDTVMIGIDEVNNGGFDLDTLTEAVATYNIQATGTPLSIAKVSSHGTGSSGSGSGSGSGSSCSPETLKRLDNFAVNGNRRIKWVVATNNYFWNGNAVAKTKNYKKKKRGGWKKYRTSTSTRVYGEMTDEQCNTYEFDVEKGPKKRRYLTIRHGNGPTTAEKNDVHGGHYGGGGIGYTSTLTWW